MNACVDSSLGAAVRHRVMGPEVWFHTLQSKGRTMPLIQNASAVSLLPYFVVFPINVADRWSMCLVANASDILHDMDNAGGSAPCSTQIFVFHEAGHSPGGKLPESYVHAVLIHMGRAATEACRPVKEVEALPIQFLEVSSFSTPTGSI